MEELYQLKTQDNNYSRSINRKYQGVTIFDDKTHKPLQGEFVIGDDIVRFQNGLLHSGIGADGEKLAAYENKNGDVEFWEQGLLHRENAPAVIRDFGTWEEWWYHGQLVEIRAAVKIEKQITA